MEELSVLFEKRLEKIEELNKAMILMTEKSKYILELKQLSRENSETEELLKLCQDKIYEFKNVLQPKCQQLIQKSQDVQLNMLHVLTELDKKEEASGEANSNMVLKTPKSSKKDYSLVNRDENILTPFNLVPSNGEDSLAKPFRRMLLSDYKDSPFVRRKRIPALQFIDFEATIDLKVFNSIPTYMKGRDTLEELNNFLHNTIIRCFTEKYILAMKDRSTITNQHDINLWKLYYNQSDYFPGKKFITQGDLSTMTQKLLDKKTSNRIQVLRHIKILREDRKNSTICYIWLKN